MEYLTDQQLGVLLSNLIQGTRSGKINWTTQSTTDFSFQTYGKEYGYVVWSLDQDDEPPFVFNINEKVTGWSVSDLTMGKRLQTLFSSNSPDFAIPLEELYFLAKGNALDIEGVARKILDDFS